MAATDSEESEFVQEIAFLVPDVETTCSICHAEFLDSEDLDVHVKQVHEGSTACPKVCQFCEGTYTDLEDYARHIRDDHLLNLKCCRCCSKCFTDLRKSKRHEKKHSHRSKMYACSQCSGLFTTIKEVKFHEILYHDNKYDGVFVRCMPHLSALLKLQVPALLQSKDPVMTCRSCYFSSVDFTSYLHHLKDQKCNVYVCDRCGVVFKNKNNLQKHFYPANKCMYLKSYSNDLATCPSCESEVLSKEMQAHLKLCKIYKCNTCNIRFKTIDELSAHQSEAHPVELDVSKCKYCSKEFVGLTSLEKHIERSHRHTFILYKYACKECDEIFKHPQNLFAHYYTKHKNLEPYTCRICDKKFKIRKRFTIHIKLEHKGNGVVEFDDRYHVFFADKKSEKPFIPTCVVPELVPVEDLSKKKKLTGKDVEVSKSQTAKKASSQNSEVNKLKDSIIEDTESGALQLLDTETEGEPEQSAIEMDREKTIVEPKKKKRKRRSNKDVISFTSSDEEDAQPLLIIKKRAERKRFQQKYPLGQKKMYKKLTKNQKQFTCTFCNKYCYTYQNYHNHIKIHSKNESIECVKCSRSFMTKKELTEHVSTDHATSKLIETLKSVLERKQIETQSVTNDNTTNMKDLAPSERFLKTFKKVKIDKTVTPATISPAPNNLSVKKFIENFMPEITEPALKEEKSDPVVTIKRYDNPFFRKHSIKMTKFTPENPSQTFKLRMPERYKEEEQEKIELNIKFVQAPLRQSMFETFEMVANYNNTENSQDHDYEDYNDGIPDVAQEVMLEGSEELPRPKVRAPHKIVIPKIPQSYPNLHIATLQPEAPFFKIIKVKGAMNEPIIIDTSSCNKKPEIPKSAKTEDVISLADGTKFVTANPLAHLLGDRQVEDVLESYKNKHYTPTITNFKGLITEALQNLDKPITRVRKPKKISTLES